MHFHLKEQSYFREKRIFYYFFGVMTLLHALFMLKHVTNEFTKTTLDEFKPLKLKLIADTHQEMRSKRQIVQSEDSVLQKKEKDAFLSDKDRSFDRETIAKNVDIFQKTAKGHSNANQALNRPLASTKKKAVDLKNLKLSDLGTPNENFDTREVKRAPASELQKGIKNGDPLSKGFSATNDYVEEVKLGDFTQLNTVEYKYYGFFHRIRQKLEQFWGKSIREKSEAMFRSGRKIASQDYVTSLQVTLNEKGEIIAVRVLGPSGVKELDEAAVESFNQAGPFPNPPKGLLVNGKATIEWGFVVKS
jgi:TonB family protein